MPGRRHAAHPPPLLRTYVYLFILAALIGAGMYGYRILVLEEASETKAPLGPTLRIADGRDNFGEVWENSEFEYVVPIENRGSEAVTISHFSSSCNCSRIEPTQLTISAGESRDLKLTLDLTARTALGERFDKPVRDFQISIEPRTDPAATQPVRFALQGRVKVAVHLANPVLHLGHHSELAQPIVVRKFGLRVSSFVKDLTVRSTSPSLKVIVQSLPSRPYQYELVASTADLLRRGFHSFEVQIFPRSASGEVLGAKRVPLHLRIERDIQVIPLAIVFGAREVGATTEESLTIQSLTKQNFQIIALETKGEGLSAEQLKVNDGVTICQLKQSILKMGEQQGEVVLRIRDQAGQEEDVSVKVTYLGIPYSGQPNE